MPLLGVQNQAGPEAGETGQQGAGMQVATGFAPRLALGDRVWWVA